MVPNHLPPPLWGRVGVGGIGNQRIVRFVPFAPTLPQKGGGSGVPPP